MSNTLAKPQTLADLLGVPDAPPAAARFEDLVDVADAKAFGAAILDSREFKQYIVDGLRLGTLPGFAGVLRFFLEHALGKPVERVEHTGAGGGPIVTEVRRVIVRADDPIEAIDDDAAAPTTRIH